MVRIFRLMLVLLFTNSINIPPIMIINRLYETQNILSCSFFSFLVGIRTYQDPCITSPFVYEGFICFWRDSPHWARASSLTRFLDHTQRRTTVGRTPLDKLSARHRDLYLTTHNNHKKQTSMPPVRFEPTISAGERP
jgi:hypothetical protein